MLLEELRSWDGTVGELVARLPTCASPGLGDLPDPDPSGLRPPPNYVKAWSAGMIEGWSGVLSAHVSLESRTRRDAATIRVWAGQLAKVLPFIEMERYRLATWLSQQLEAAGGVLEPWRGTDISGLEIGPLAACLLTHRKEHRMAVPTERVDLLCDLRNARNSLAHRQPLDPATVISLRRRACVDRRR